MDNLKLRDYVNVHAHNEMDILMRPSRRGKDTGSMKHKEVIGRAIPLLNEAVIDYCDNKVKPKLETCKSLQEIEKLEPRDLPQEVVEVILEFVDLQVKLNIVEKTYIFLDMCRSAQHAIVNNVRNMALHYSRMLGSDGGRIVGLNGKPLK